MTDYGYRDVYVGVVKAVIKSINQDAEIIDITHGITRHDVLEAAVMLNVSADYFPRGTIFLVIVDPSVGTTRRALLLETTRYVLLGPDNGCLTLLAERDGVKRAFDISNSDYRLPEVSQTFHGRDIFAPVAAWVSRGIPLEDVGVEIAYESLLKITVEKPSINVEEGSITGSILYVDIYGNVMTNIKARDIEALKLPYGTKLQLVLDDKNYTCIYETTFCKVSKGEMACYINSWGFFEVAIYMGNAAKFLGADVYKRVKVKKVPTRDYHMLT